LAQIEEEFRDLSSLQASAAGNPHESVSKNTLHHSEILTPNPNCMSLSEEKNSLIMVADDVRVNLEAIKLDLESIGQLKRSEFYVNGQEVVDRIYEYVGEAILVESATLTLCPV
jgi:hypothetical protein